MSMRRRILGTLGAGIAVLGVAWVDIATGPDVAVSLLYLVPVVASGYFIGRSSAAIAAAVGTIASFTVAAASGDPRDPLLLWEGVTSLTIFVSVGILTARLRRSRDELAALSTRLHWLLAGESALARTDPLTGLANVRGFHEALAAEISRCSRSGNAVCMAYIDLDSFKDLNDARGHLAGDEFLRAVAATLRDTVRASDVPARVGGDEFVVLLTDVSLKAAETVANRFVQRIGELARAYSPCQLGASVGVAYFEQTPAHANAVIVAADDAMYEAKAKGKGRVVIWREGKADGMRDGAQAMPT